MDSIFGFYCRSCREKELSYSYSHFCILRVDGKLSPTALALTATGGAKAAEPAPESKWMETFQIGSYIGLWYLFNIAYNIYNKQSLNVLNFPWTIAAIQMAVGILYFVPLWLLGIRKAPKLNADKLKTLFPIALCHTGVHVGAVVALGAGAVSFAHIVKTSEPVVTCALNFAFLGEVLPLSVYLTLIPIVGGVGIALLILRNSPSSRIVLGWFRLKSDYRQILRGW